MDNRNNLMSPDPDRSEGSAKKMGGNLKEGTGKVLGDEKMRREGQSDKAEGKLQNAWGSIKDTVREAVDTDGRR